MKLEDQKQIEILKDEIICSKASLVYLKNKKLSADKEYEREKARLHQSIKNHEEDIKILEDAWQNTDIDMWIEKENEKEHKRLEKLTPEERMQEELERMEGLREAEKKQWNCS